MDNSKSKSHQHHPQQDQVQAIYLAQANIFSYEARKSAKSWVPLCDSTVPISILYDNTRSIYRIISVDADIKEVVVNTTVIPELEFVKTTQKFGYWKDIASGRVFGIGFASEYEAEAFDECLRKVKQNIGPPSINSSVSLNSDSGHHIDSSSGSHNVQQSNSSSGSPPLQRLYPAGHDDAKDHRDHYAPSSNTTIKLPPIAPTPTTTTPRGCPITQLQLPPAKKQVNWDDYDQIGPAVLSFMNNNRQQQHQQAPHHAFLANNHSMFGPSDHRPSTYKVDLPIINGGNSMPGTAASHSKHYGATSPPQQQNMDELRMSVGAASLPPPAPAPYHHHVPYQPYYGSPSSAVEQPSTSGAGPPAPLMPLTMSIPHGYCYQGPPPLQTTTNMVGTAGGAGDSSRGIMDGSMKVASTTADLLDELNRLKSENVKLSESLIETTCNAKKWELQVSSIREDNIQLVKSVAELNSKVDSLNKDCREYKEQASRWKEHYQQAVTSAKEKSQNLKEAEEKLKCCSVDKSRIESVMKDLEEELKRQQQINKEQLALNNSNVVGQFSNKYFKELEDHYRKLLADSQKRIEEVLRKDGDRKNVLRGVDTLFTGAIQGLINIHGQIRQAYEQQ